MQTTSNNHIFNVVVRAARDVRSAQNNDFAALEGRGCSPHGRELLAPNGLQTPKNGA